MTWQHGYSAYRKGLCKCEVCTADNSRRCRRDFEARLAERVEIDGRLIAVRARNHGSYSTYRNWGCRCTPCYEAHSRVMRAYKQAVKTRVS